MSGGMPYHSGNQDMLQIVADFGVFSNVFEDLRVCVVYTFSFELGPIGGSSD